jgi:transcriptional regulator with XRE-family HTH domain
VNNSNAAATRAEEKLDVSNLDSPQLLPKLFDYFHNNREELARALGIHRSTVDRWFSGKSRPNNSTLLRMRRLAQERGIQ